jgi:hypothetical protein
MMALPDPPPLPPAADFVLHELARLRPASLWAQDALAQAWANAHAAAHPCRVITGSSDAVAELALVGDALAALDKPAAMILLAGLIRLSPLVIAAVPEGRPLAFADFLSLGMQRLQTADADGRAVYGFDLHHYKTVPDWLNARFWAHPERWEA